MTVAPIPLRLITAHQACCSHDDVPPGHQASYDPSEHRTVFMGRHAGQVLVGQVTRLLAGIGQYVIPLPILAGAVASIMGRRKRRALVRDLATGSASDGLNTMTWQDFELLVGEAFRQRGFSVAETGGGGTDGGIATGGFVVTSGVFTADAQSFARGRNIELIDGPALQRMIQDARAAQPTLTQSEGESSRRRDPKKASRSV